ncbi:MAG: 6-bladed beta-propeller [Acidobacteria bacterium]|nr:6-bladed beta-propeller [Acidobacteriota bacterium]
MAKDFLINRKELIFEEIASICEDEKENFYVLDSKAFKIHKFSKNGELLISFGNHGQGPADFISPHAININSQGNIVVNESRDYISFFNDNGCFLKRIKVPKGLSLYFIKDDLFLGWIWTPIGKQQVLLDQEGKQLRSFFSISSDSFSISAPDENGRAVSFNYFVEEYTPFFIFHQYKTYTAIGVSNKYEIILMNNEVITATISRNEVPFTLNPKEKEYFTENIKSDYKLPDFAKKKFLKKIPEYKNYYNHLLISEQYVWVFRITGDILDDKALIPVDLFSLDALFKGKVYCPALPHHISRKYIYIVDADSEDNLILIRYSFTLS